MDYKEEDKKGACPGGTAEKDGRAAGSAAAAAHYGPASAPAPGKGEHRPGAKALQERRRRYAAMPVEGQLRENLRRLGHMLYHGSEHRGGQFRALAILSAYGPMGQRELGEYLDVRAGSLSELLAKLEAAGFILRTTNEQDRRNTDVALTARGRAASAAHEVERAEKTRGMFQSLTAEEKQQLNGLLERLCADWRTHIFPLDPAAPAPSDSDTPAAQSPRDPL